MRGTLINVTRCGCSLVSVSGGGQQHNGQGEAACCLDKVTRGQEPAGALPGAARRAGGGKLPRLHHHRAPAPPRPRLLLLRVSSVMQGWGQYIVGYK